MKIVPEPPLPTRSRPWSKNWPNSVNIELNEAEMPSSGAMFGMNTVPEFGSVGDGVMVRPISAASAISAAFGLAANASAWVRADSAAVTFCDAV